VLTGLLDVGATAGRGTVLYTADGEPVAALIGDLPAWRSLQVGIDDGADVRQLEENLAALGYGGDLDVDGSFTTGTAAAVEAWETDLGRAHPDGTVEVGDVVFLSAPGDVLGHDAEVGDTVQPGAPVLTIGAEQRVVVAGVDAAEAGGWAPGSAVELEWADGTTSEGTVFATGREVTDGQVDLVVALDGGAADLGDRRTGSEATVTLEEARRDGAVAVPVAALVEHDGGPAVRVAEPGGGDQGGEPDDRDHGDEGNGADELVPVETGLVAGGWVEITAGLDGGERVRLPG
jgi:peptidoglycan hydrolase-like protein with peptidoglycan-binding domain